MNHMALWIGENSLERALTFSPKVVLSHGLCHDFLSRFTAKRNSNTYITADMHEYDYIALL